MSILWQFDATAEPWDGQLVETPEYLAEQFAGHYYLPCYAPPSLPHGAASITGSYDFHSARYQNTAAPDVCGGHAFLAYAWRQSPHIPDGGLVHRLHFELSVTEWAKSATDGNAVMQWLSSKKFKTDPGQWGNDRLAFHVDHEGHLKRFYGSVGTAVLELGTLYDIEIVITIDVAAQTKTYIAYVDGVQDSTEVVPCNLYVWNGSEWVLDTYPPTYAEILAGCSWGIGWGPGVDMRHDQTVHIGDLVWTIESTEVGTGYWTMMVMV